jgi:hypothetical protein
VKKNTLGLKNLVKEFEGYKIFWVFGEISPLLRIKLVNFWIKNKALQEEHAAWRRTFEVMCIILNNEDDIVGVSSAAPFNQDNSKEHFWFYRSFIDSRYSIDSFKFLMPYYLLEKTSTNLALLASEPGAPQGILITIENEKLKSNGMEKVFMKLGFVKLIDAELLSDHWKKYFVMT